MIFKNYLEKIFKDTCKDIRNGENIDIYFIVALIILQIILRVVQIYFTITDKINEPLTLAILFSLSISLLNSRRTIQDLAEIIKKNTCHFSDDVNIIDIRDDYQSTVKQFLQNTKSKSSLKLVLRTGKIIKDLDTEFEKILERGCKIDLIMCNRKNSNLIKEIGLYSEKNSTEIQINANFDLGEEEIKKLERNYSILINKKIVDFHPPELLYISDHDDCENGQTYVLPFSYNSSVREAPSILFKNSDNPKLFEYYSELFDRMWEDNKND
ncbi:MAG: hypothetical protein QNJ37_16710 [Crocosphaera sp.]|nr:hypothetical protein [Crocosphaera sp.]